MKKELKICDKCNGHGYTVRYIDIDETDNSPNKVIMCCYTCFGRGFFMPDHCFFCNKSHHIDLHANFNFYTNQDVLIIIDRNGFGKSVTNDIEFVLFNIEESLKGLTQNADIDLKRWKIIYKDSEGY